MEVWWGYRLVRRVLAQHARGPGFHPQQHIHERWWLPIYIPTLRRERQDDREFQVILGYVAYIHDRIQEILNKCS